MDTKTLNASNTADRELVIKEFGAIDGGKQTMARLSGHLKIMAA